MGRNISVRLKYVF